MITIKGFFSNPKLFNNSDNTDAVFGELTQHACTFSRDYKTYSKDGDVLFCMFSAKDGTVKTSVGKEFTDLGCDVGNWCYSVSHSFSNTSSKIEFINLMQTAFGNKIFDINCTELIADSNRRLPEWVSWKTNGQSGVYNYKVWLSSTSFKNSYDEFEIIIVPPVEDINNLLQNFADVLTVVKANNLAILHERLLTIRGNYPETMIQTEMIELIDRTNPNNKVSLGWTALIYGPAGNSSDSIKDAIKSYIAANSTSEEFIWRQLMPDLFNTTCFYVLPRWDLYAIESRSSMPGIHSPVINASSNLTWVRQTTSNYLPQTHINEHLQTTIHRYRSITLNIVGGEFNRLGMCKFTDYFSDYLALESTTEDFNRQTQATKDITNLLTNILSKIDRYSVDTTLAVNLRVIEKYNQKFLVGKYANVEYYVLMKPEHQP